MPDSPYRLRVEQFEQVCRFDLTWGQGQHLAATLPYPTVLTQLYQDWQQVYISFYTTQTLPSATIPESPSDGMRGRVVGEAKLSASTVDLHANLVQAEAALLHEFQRWLRDAELYEIREAIAYASREATGSDRQGIDVFLTCTPINLARFPWESWEICTDFTGTGTTRIVRTPANVSGKPNSSVRRSRRKRARILAIMGDARRLNLQADQEIIRSLGQQAEVQFIRWQPTESPAHIRNKIKQVLTDAEGWDGLFFAGHSNETQITGGELSIAPGSSIQISEITHELTIAKEKGLKFAIFNSCSGIKVAESLIRTGISQVVIMREPIHDTVAQEFLVQFVHCLGEYKDVQESLISTYKFLRLEKKFTYPSAYLVPSLFYHPGATLFRLQPYEPTWKRLGRKFVPSRLEAIALVTCLTLLWMPSIQRTLLPARMRTISPQDLLLDRRTWAQAMYRQFTGQVSSSKPLVTLIQIDKESIEADGIAPVKIKPSMDRSYISKIVDRLAAQNAKIIGIDFLLDRQQQPEDEDLRDAVWRAVDKRIAFPSLLRYSSSNG